MKPYKSVAQLSWSDRFTIIQMANASSDVELTNEQICSTFGVDSEELAVALECFEDGIFKTNNNKDYSPYLPLFEGKDIQLVDDREPRQRTLPEIVVEALTPEERQLFASKRKTGRKGNNITRAFKAVPHEPVPVDEFSAKHNVSVAVLRQYKRFDKTGGARVYVRKDKETGVIMIWREKEEE